MRLTQIFFQNPISMLHIIRIPLQQGLEAGMVAEEVLSRSSSNDQLAKKVPKPNSLT